MSSRLRWWLVALLFAASIMNYVDRQTFSILAHEVQNALRMSDVGYSNLVQLFLISYTIAYLVAGRVTDYLGTKLAMEVFIVWWSISEVLSGFARSVFSLGACRFLLGVGEPGNWTVQSKAIAEWFPPEARGLAYGICTAGATVGATVAVPLVAFLGAGHGWRVPFVVTGSCGLLWVIPWAVLYKSPHDSQQISNPGAATAQSVGRPVLSRSQSGERQRWALMLQDRNTWLMTLARFLTDPVWYFYLFWFPKYLLGVRNLSLIRVGQLAWLVYFAATVGTILGGWASGFLIQRGLRPVAARKAIMLICALLVPFTAFVPYVPTIIGVLGIGSVAVLSQLAWQVTLGALIMDVYPQKMVATVFGIIAAGSGLGGILSTNAIGHLVTSFSYRPVYLLMACLHPSALYLLWNIRDPGSAQGMKA
jgi:ACS family hexuronate transporter-like MFS transporter